MPGQGGREGWIEEKLEKELYNAEKGQEHTCEHGKQKQDLQIRGRLSRKPAPKCSMAG